MPSADDDGTNAELVDMTRRFWMSLALTVPVLALAMGEMLAPALLAPIGAWGVLWVQLALTTPVVLWGGWPFFVRGWESIIDHRLSAWQFPKAPVAEPVSAPRSPSSDSSRAHRPSAHCTPGSTTGAASASSSTGCAGTVMT